MNKFKKSAMALTLLTLSACQPSDEAEESALSASPEQQPSHEIVAETSSGSVDVATAEAFLAEAESRLEDASEYAAHAAWLASNFINVDSQFVKARAGREYTLLSVKYAKEAARFDGLDLDPQTRRKLQRLKLDLSFPAPADDALAGELAVIGSKMQGMYGEGEYCTEDRCYSLEDMNKIFATSRDAELLKTLWAGWRTVSPPMRPMYQRQVEIANAGASELGYANLSVLWRSKYDMDPDAFARVVDEQWHKVQPLYEALHCHIRAKLNEFYGGDRVSPSGMIPAHLLGNMWAQSWSNIYSLVKPEDSEQSYDVTKLIEAGGMSEIDMVKTAEGFFTSLGFDPLPETFWKRSLFTKPQDREVVCHASAWDVDDRDDLRIKMCIEKTANDFQTVHHELGHNFYQRAYKDQPYLFKGSANDGFHEAVGDTIALSLTPSYLVQLGMLDKEPPVEEDLGYLMRLALDKIAFLPFGLLVDKWRWQVFNGELAPADYNKGWWTLREQYQGITAPVARSEADFDPGAKYHIPGNTPYMRYFLAYILQFQFHKALCDAAGYEGPLHRCSIYNNPQAGARLKAMLEMGASRPWPEAMEAITGQRELNAAAIMDYFEPLKEWLDKQNKNRQCGW